MVMRVSPRSGLLREAAITWDYNPLGRSYIGSGEAEGSILLDVTKKGGRVTEHLDPKLVINTVNLYQEA